MRIHKSFDFDCRGPAFPYRGEIEEPSLCPICRHALKPQELYVSSYVDESRNWHIAVLYLCQSCYKVFTALYNCNLRFIPDRSIKTFTSELEYLAPVKFEEQKFDESIALISPRFVKIYNQALTAESSSLDEIAGLGYRKALEFLIKDFCIHLHTDDEEKIKRLPLSKCITEYISSPEIKALASRAAWIGNDEAHYVRKFEDRDIEDMKKFIQAAVYFIGMILITEDAHGMDPA